MLPRVSHILLLLSLAHAFVVGPLQSTRKSTWLAEQQSVTIDPTLDDEKVTALFAWISRAFAGEPEYNNLVLAIATIFGDLPKGSEPYMLLEKAVADMPGEEVCMGDPVSVEDREYDSMGAMGAGQWLGQFKTRPHALLELKNVTSVDDWVSSLPRGCRRTLKKALAQNFTVTTKPILGKKPAPHSSLAHFRCVVEHEVRLIADGTEGFLDSLSMAISRYVGTTRQAGDIQEYRDENGKVIAIAHEIRKGGAMRGQWFYSTDQASKSYVWFHSVHDLVRRAIDAEGVDVVDLGPSGSDAFSELKAKYGFRSVDMWHEVADYSGPFWYNGAPRENQNFFSSLF